LSEFLGGLNKYQGVIFGLALIAVISAVPEGLVGAGLWRKAAGLWFRGRSSSDTEPEVLPDAALDAVPVPAAASMPAPVGAAVPVGVAGVGVDGVGVGSGLVVRGAQRRFGGVLAVDDVDLTVRPGSIHALIGPNGSGKTTLLNLISGFYRLERGVIEVDGERVDGHGPAFVARHGVARSFQTPKLLTDRDVHYNVIVAADFSTRASGFESVFRLPRGRRARRQADELAADCLAQVGLSEYAAVIASKVPHGMQRLIEVARGIALGPKFFLLDEPAAGLSPHEVEIMKSVVRALAHSGVGVLLVEHNLPLVLDLADEITVLHRGQRLAHGTPDEVAANDEVARVYLGREPVVVAEGGAER
jgi:branched-chain amino acid transport system permease protein